MTSPKDAPKPDQGTTTPSHGHIGHRQGTELHQDLDYQGKFIAFATRYRELGWRLSAMDAQELVDLEVNFEDAPELWFRHLNLLGALRDRVILGVHTGAASRLLIVEVPQGPGEAALDQHGEWRSCCRARVDSRQQHYYALPPGSSLPPTCFLLASQVMIFGDQGVALMPPSRDAQVREFWRWLHPPWDFPPPEPPRPLWDFLEKHLPLASPREAEPVVISSWDEVYQRIMTHERIMRALLAPAPSPDTYYRHLLLTALEVGFLDQALLLGLLWHAPHKGDLSAADRQTLIHNMVAECLGGCPGNTGPPGADAQKQGAAGAKGPANSSRLDDILQKVRQLSHKTEQLETRLSHGGPQPEDGQEPASPPEGEAMLASCLGQSLGFVEQCAAMDDFLNSMGERLEQGKKQEAALSASPATGGFKAEIRLTWSELKQIKHMIPDPEVIAATVCAYLEENPDLAADPFIVRMIHYCLNNYVNIDPELGDLSLTERVERASQMAKEFLSRSGRA